MFYGTQVHARGRRAGRGGKLAYGADIHGEIELAGLRGHHVPGRPVRLGQAPPADGDRRAHEVGDRRDALRRASSRRSRTPSGGNEAEYPRSAIPTKPARWATVWDTLGYTDTGLHRRLPRHRARRHRHGLRDLVQPHRPGEGLERLLQENHINATRGIIKTAMAYAMYQDEEFTPERQDRPERPRRLRRQPRAGHRQGRERSGTQPGPSENGIGENGKQVKQRPTTPRT